MKKFLLSFFVLAVACVLNASAEVVENYQVDFNTTIDTSSETFKVAPGWLHVIDKTTGSAAAMWSYYSDRGVDGSGCISMGTKSSYYYKEYLVTPALTGKMTIQVYGITESSMSIKFYNCTDGGVVGEELTATSENGVVYQGWTTFTVEGLSGQRVAIDASAVRIDNFAADQADIQLEKTLEISSAKLLSVYNPDCNDVHEYPVKAQVVLKNTGERDFEPATNFVSLYNYSVGTDRVIASADLTETLAVGATVTLTLEGTANTADDKTSEGGTDCEWYAIEHYSNKIKSVGTVSPVEYAPVLVVSSSEGVQTSPLTKKFGNINADKTATYTLSNTGAAPLNITSITTPDAGFSVEVKQGDAAVTAPFTIEAHGSATMTVTALSAEQGTFEKSVVISGTDVEDFTLNFQSKVLDANKFYVNFEEGSIPAGFLNEGSWSTGYYGYDENLYCEKQSSSSLRKLITPLLEVAGADDVLQFDIARNSSSYDPTLNILYSTDRENWTTLKEFAVSEFGTEYATGSSYTYALATTEVSGIPAGKYYIAFEGSRVNMDNIYGFKRVDVDHDVLINSITVPETAMQNTPCTVSVVAKNINNKDDNAYAELYCDDVKVATSEALDIVSNKTTTYTMSFNPHELGDHTVYAKVIAGTQELTSESKTVNVTAEVANAEITVGTASSSLSSGIVYPYYKNSQSEVVYTAAKLAQSGLKDGDKISSMTFRGVTAGGIAPTMQFYIANTDNTDVPDLVNGSLDGMTKVYDGAYELKATASTSKYLSCAEDVIVINFTEPFTYTGGNIRIAGKSSSDSYKSVYFEIDDTDDTGCVAYLKYKDDPTACASATMSKISLPVVHFDLVVEPVVAEGVVKDKATGEPIQGASIVIKNEEKDVIYTATSDAEGKFSVNVIQNSIVYNVTCSYEGYTSQTVNGIDFNVDPTACQLFELVKDVPTSINGVETADNDENVATFNIAGQRVNASHKGLIIRNGRKYIKK